MQLVELTLIEIAQFQEDLITWFKDNQRSLPWRKDQDPYKVWVSEIMLQQTRVDTVIPYFHRFMDKFPTVEALAHAEEIDVLKAWEGLGYYSRARNLQAAVKEVFEQYGGIVPNSKAEISSLKGVGPYTAGAILSIAYGKPEPAVDGNVMRVISRIFASFDDISKQTTRKKIEALIAALISHDDPSSFNQGIMELGALICTPTSPSCVICPVQTHCKAYKEGIQKQLPVKAKKKKQQQVKLVCAFIKDAAGNVLISQRPETGLLASMWEFPNVELTNEKLKERELAYFLEKQFHIHANIAAEIFHVEHVFSHLKWDVTVLEVELLSMGRNNNNANVHWVSATEIDAYPFPVSHQKIIKHCLKGDEI